MLLATRNDDVFLMSRPEIVASGNVSVTETREAGCQPVLIGLIYAAQDASEAAISVTWNPISEVRQTRGEMTDLTVTISRTGEIRRGDIATIRFPLRPDQVWDQVYSTIGAIAFRIADPASILGAELGFGTEAGLGLAHPFTLAPVAHLATAFRFNGKPAQPYMELRVHLRESPAPVSIRIGRVFAGPHYDPYIFNPAYEYLAFIKGKPAFPGGEEVLADFERSALEATRSHSYTGMQAFIHPYLVMREGKPDFPMLVGTPNSMSWYSSDPSHGIEMYHRDGYIRSGDVVLDCGAHAGQMSTLFGLVAGSAGKVFAFDPFPQNYLQVEAQGRLNGLDNIVSTRAGVAETRRAMDVSIRGQSIWGQKRAEKDMMSVDLVPLDDFIDAKPTFIKLDVEGAEVSALQGAQKLLHDCKPSIFVELHTDFLPNFGFTVKDFFDQIPRDIYDVKVEIEGGPPGWHQYVPGEEVHITRPGLVWATPR